VEKVMLTEIQMQELWDKQALHENMFTYCRGIDRMDLDLMKSTYWPDGTDDHGRFVGPNHEWCEVGMKSREALVSCNHHCTNVLIELNGDQAKRETMFIVVTTYKEHGNAMFLGGRYRDLCEKRAGEWKVLHRTCVWDGTSCRPLSCQTGDFSTLKTQFTQRTGGFASPPLLQTQVARSLDEKGGS
jgi:hypothetical protein